MKKHCSPISVKVFPLPAFYPPDAEFWDDFYAMTRAIADFFEDVSDFFEDLFIKQA